MIREFKSKKDELQYYRNYIRKVLRERHKEHDFYDVITALNNTLENIKDKRDFYELRSFAYDAWNVEGFIKRAGIYFDEEEIWLKEGCSRKK